MTTARGNRRDQRDVVPTSLICHHRELVFGLPTLAIACAGVKPTFVNIDYFLTTKDYFDQPLSKEKSRLDVLGPVQISLLVVDEPIRVVQINFHHLPKPRLRQQILVLRQDSSLKILNRRNSRLL